MKIEETLLNGCYLISPKLFKDDRGLFFEGFNQQKFEETIGKIEFVQDNISISRKGTLRGLHFQKREYTQAKLISVLKGKVQDVVVDLRKGSSTFGQTHSIVLDDIKRQQFFIPEGFAHGFLALTDEVIFNYKCDNYYNKESETGIIYNDKELNIDWRLPEDELLLSEKDKRLPNLKNLDL